VSNSRCGRRKRTAHPRHCPLGWTPAREEAAKRRHAPWHAGCTGCAAPKQDKGDSHARTRQIVHGRGNVTLFKLADRINKVPAHVIAWASGWGESIRSQIRPMCEPMRISPLVKPNYFAMIAFCRP
jgi:hypothetical protein